MSDFSALALVLSLSMVYKSKAQQQAELTELSKVLFVTAFDMADDEDEDLEGDLNDGDKWLLDDDQGNEVLETIALRALGFAESMSGDGS